MLTDIGPSEHPLRALHVSSFRTSSASRLPSPYFRCPCTSLLWASDPSLGAHCQRRWADTPSTS